MTTAYTSLLGLALPVTGELSGTWGDTVNTAITSLLDTAVAGTTSITTDADITLTTTTGASNQARQAIILWNPASGTTTRNITAPAQSKIYTVINASGGTQSIVIRGAGPTTGVTVAKGESATVAWNGSDFVKVGSSGGAITFTDLTVTGNTILGDAAADTLTVNATSTFASPVSFQNLVRLPSTGRSAAAALTVTAPAFLYGVASTYTDTTSSGTIAAMAPFYSIAQPTLSTSNVTTYTNAATLYIANAPAAGGSATITNPYALYIAAGSSYFADNVTLGSSTADSVAINGTVVSNLIFTDNTYDIGASGATRPRSLFLGSNLDVAGTSLLTGNVGIGAANATSAKLQVSDVGRFGTYLATGSRYLQLDYDTSATSSWNFGNYDFATAAITQDFIYNRFNGTTWSAQGVLRLRTSGNVSMNYNLSVATTDSNPWGTVGFRAVQLFDLTGGSFAGSGYSAYVSANTYNDGAGWLRVGASFAPSGYQQFDGSHIFQYAATGAAGSAITFIKALETTKTGSVSIPGFLGVNATPASNYAARLGATNTQLRLELSTATRYRSDFAMRSTGLEINAFDDTGVVFLPGLYSFSNHTFQYGTVTQAAAATINTSGVFATTFDAYFNSVRVGRGGGGISNNTAVGVNALNGSTTGIGNTALGYGAGGNITNSPYNTAVGLNALGCATGPLTGAEGSTAVGVNSLYNLTSGDKNTSVGRDAGYTMTTGQGNVIVGYGAGFLNNSSGNTFIGLRAGEDYTGSNSVYLGNLAGVNATTGNYNTFLGDETGYGHTAGGNNTFVGVGAAYGANTLTNTLVIGQYNGDTGQGPGEQLTSGSNNTLVGGFTGNQHTLDIRGLSQQIVISDGAGYPSFHNNVSKIATNNFGHIDVTSNSVSTVNVLAVANGTAVSLFGGGNDFSGLILINDISTTGSAALFIVGGQASIFKISESSTNNNFQANNSTPTGGNTGVYMSGNAFTLVQNSGGTINYRIIALRTRVSL